jgi:hypothetical protein
MKTTAQVAVLSCWVVSKGIFSVLLAFLLAAFNIQCVAFCAAEFRNASVPPCHRHHDTPSQQDSAACHHGLAGALDAATVVTAQMAAGGLVALPLLPRFEFPRAPGADEIAVRAPSPPGLDRISSVVLRT